MPDTPSNYTEFDKKLLDLIKAGGATSRRLTVALDAESKPFMKRRGEEFRVVDRRLQALRAKGIVSWRRQNGFNVWLLAGTS